MPYHRVLLSSPYRLPAACLFYLPRVLSASSAPLPSSYLPSLRWLPARTVVALTTCVWNHLLLSPAPEYSISVRAWRGGAARSRAMARSPSLPSRTHGCLHQRVRADWMGRTFAHTMLYFQARVVISFNAARFLLALRRAKRAYGTYFSTLVFAAAFPSLAYNIRHARRVVRTTRGMASPSERSAVARFLFISYFSTTSPANAAALYRCMARRAPSFVQRRPRCCGVTIYLPFAQRILLQNAVCRFQRGRAPLLRARALQAISIVSYQQNFLRG